MISIFKDVKDLTKVRKEIKIFENPIFYQAQFLQIKDVQADCLTSRLFYKAATVIHGLALLLLGMKQYFGDPIECDCKQSEAVDKKLLENFCWISSTWTVWEYYQPEMNRSKIVHQGVGVEKWGVDYTRIYHRYYQWIPTVLSIYIVSLILF